MAQSKFVKTNEEIAKKVVGTFEKIEETVVGSYAKVEDAFVDRYLIRDGETVEDAKARLKGEQKQRESSGGFEKSEPPCDYKVDRRLSKKA